MASRDPGGAPTPTNRRAALQTLKPGAMDSGITPAGISASSFLSSSSSAVSPYSSNTGVANLMMNAAATSNTAMALQQQQQRAAAAASMPAKTPSASNVLMTSAPSANIPAESRIAQLTSTMEALRKWNAQLDDRLTIAQGEINRWRAHYELAEEKATALAAERDQKDFLTRQLTQKVSALGEVVMSQSRDNMAAQRVLADAETISMEEARRMETAIKTARVEADAAMETARMSVQRASAEAANRIMAAAAANDREMAELRERNASETAAMLAASTAEFERAKQTSDARYADLAKHCEEIQAALHAEQRLHGDEVAAIKKQGQDELAAAKFEADAVLSATKAILEADLAETKNKAAEDVRIAQEELASRTATFHSEIDRVARERAARLASIALEHNRALTDLANEYEDAQAKMSELHQEEVRQLTETAEQIKREMQSLLNEAISRHNAESTETNARHAAQLSEAEAKRVVQIAEAEAARISQVAESESRRSIQVREAEERRIKEVSELEALRVFEKEAAEARRVQELADARAKAETEAAEAAAILANAAARHAADVSDIEIRHAAELADAAAQLAAVKARHEEELATRDAEETAMRDGFARIMNEAQQSADFQLESALQEMRESIGALENKLEVQALTAAAEAQQLRTEKDRDIAGLLAELEATRKESKLTLEETTDMYEGLLKDMREKTAEESADAARLHVEAVADLEAAQSAALERAQNEAEALLKSTLADLESRRNAEISALKTELVAKTKEMAERIHHIETTAQEALSSLETSSTSKLEATLESHRLEIAAMVHRHEAELESMRSGYEKMQAAAVDSLTSAYDKQLAAQEARLREKEESMASLRTQLTEVRAAREDSVAARVAEAQRAYNNERRALEAELANARAFSNKAKSEQDALLTMSAEADAQLMEARANHAQEIAALMEAHEAGIRDVTASALVREAEIEAEADARFDDDTARHNAEIFELRAALSEMAALADRAAAEHEAELQRMGMLYEASVAGMAAAHDAAAREADAVTDARVAAARAEATLIEGAVLHAKERSDTASRVSRETAVSALLEERDSTISALKSHYEGLLRDVRARSERITDGMNASHAAELSVLRDMYDKEKAASAEAAAKVASTLADVRATYEALGASQSASWKEAYESRVATLANKIESYEKLIVETRGQLAEARAQVEKEIGSREAAEYEAQDLRKALQGAQDSVMLVEEAGAREVNAVRAAYEATIKNMRELNETNLSLLRDSYEKQLGEQASHLQGHHETLAAEVEKNKEAVVQSVQEKSRTEMESRDTLVASLREQLRTLEQQSAESRALHTRDMDELRHSHERSLAAALQNVMMREEQLRQTFIAEKAVLERDHARNIGSLQAQLEGARVHVERRDDEQEALMAINKAHEITVEELKARNEAALSALIEAHEASVREIEGRAQVREEIVAQEIATDAARMNDQQEALIADLQTQVEALTHLMTKKEDEHLAEMKHSRDLFDDGIQALRASHKAALAEVEANAAARIATAEASAANVEASLRAGSARSEISLRAASEAAVGTALAERDAAIAKASESESSHLASLRERHERIVQELAASHATEMQSLRERHTTDVGEMKKQQDSLASSLQELRDAYAKAQAGFETATREAVQQRDAAAAERIHALESTILGLRSDVAQVKDDVKLAAQREADVRVASAAQHEDLMKRASDESIALRARIDSLLSESASERLAANTREATLRNALSEAQMMVAKAEAAAQVTDLRKVYESSMEQWKKAHDETVTVLRSSQATTEVEASRAVAEAEKRMSEAHMRELAAVKAEAESNARTQASLHNTAIVDLNSRIAQLESAVSAAASTTPQLQSMLHAQQRAAAETSASHEASVTALRKAYETQLQEAAERAQSNMESTTAACEAKLATLRTAAETRESQLHAEHAAIVAELRARIAQGEAALERASSDHSRQIAAARDTADAAAAQVRASHESALAELKSSYDKTLAQALSAVMAKEATLRSIYAAERAEAATAAAKDQLALRKQIDTLRAALEVKSDENMTGNTAGGIITAALKEQHDQEVARLQVEKQRAIEVAKEEQAHALGEANAKAAAKDDSHMSSLASREAALRAEHSQVVSGLQARVRELSQSLAGMAAEHTKQMADMMAEQASALATMKAAIERAAAEKIVAERAAFLARGQKESSGPLPTAPPLPPLQKGALAVMKLENVDYTYVISDANRRAQFEHHLLADLAHLSGVQPGALYLREFRAGSLVVMLQGGTPEDAKKIRAVLATPTGRASIESSASVTSLRPAGLEDASRKISSVDATEDYDEVGNVKPEVLAAAMMASPGKSNAAATMMMNSPDGHNNNNNNNNNNNQFVAAMSIRHDRELAALRNAQADSVSRLLAQIAALEERTLEAQSARDKAVIDAAASVAAVNKLYEGGLPADKVVELKTALSAAEKRASAAEVAFEKAKEESAAFTRESNEATIRAAAAHERDVGVIRASHAAEVNELRDALARASSRAETATSALDAASKSASEVADLSLRLAALQADHTRAMAEAEARFAAALGEAQGQYKASVAALNEANAANEVSKARAISEARDEATKRANEVTKLYETRALDAEHKLALVTEKSQLDLASSEARRSSEVETLMTKYTTELAEANRKLVEKEETRFSEYRTNEEKRTEEVSSVQSKMDVRIKALEESAATREAEAKRIAEEAGQRALSELTASHNAEVQKLAASFDEEKARMQVKLQDTTISLKTQQAAALEAEGERLRKEKIAAVEETTKLAERQLSAVREDMRRQLASSEAKISELTMQAVTEQAKAHGRAEAVANLRKRITELESEKNTLTARIDKEIALGSQALEKQSKHAQDEKAADLARAQADHESAIRALRSEFDTLRAADAIRLSEAAADGREELLKKLETQYKAQLEDATVTWKAKIDAQQVTIETLQRQVQASNTAHAEAETKLQDLATKLLNANAAQESDWVHRVQALETGYETRLQSLTEERDAARRTADRAVMDAVTAATAASAVSTSELKTQLLEMEVAKKRAENETREVRATHAMELDRVNATWAAKVSATEAEGANKLVATSSEANSRLKELYNSSHEATVTLEKEWAAKLEEAISRERAQRDAAVRDAEDSSHAALASVTASFERELAEARTAAERVKGEHAKLMQQEIARHSEEIATVRTDSEAKLVKVREDHEASLRTLAETHHGEIAKLHSQLSAMESNNTELDSVIKSLTADFKTALAQAEAHASARLAEVTAAAAADSRRQTEEYAASIASLRSAFAPQLAAVEARCAETQALAVEAVRKEAAAAADAYRADASQAFEKISSELTERKVELGKLHAEHAACGPTFDQQRNTLVAMLEAERAEHSASMSALRSETNEALERAQSAAISASLQLKTSLEILQAEHAHELSEARAATEEAKRSAARELADVISAKDAAFAEAKENARIALESAIAAATEAATKAKEDAAAVLAKTISDAELTLTQTREDAAAQLVQVRAESAASLAAAEAGATASIAAAQADATATVQAAREETSKALAKAQEDMNTLKEQGVRALAEAQVKFDELLNAAATTEARRLSDGIAYEEKLREAAAERLASEERLVASYRDREERIRAKQVALDTASSDVQARLNSAMVEKNRLVAREKELIARCDELRKEADNIRAASAGSTAEGASAKATLDREARRWAAEREAFAKTESELRDALRERTSAADALQDRAAKALAASAAQARLYTEEHEKIIKARDDQITRLRGMVIESQREINRLRGETKNLQALAEKSATDRVGAAAAEAVASSSNNNNARSGSNGSTGVGSELSQILESGYSGSLEDLAKYDVVDHHQQQATTTASYSNTATPASPAAVSHATHATATTPVGGGGGGAATAIDTIEAGLAHPEVSVFLQESLDSSTKRGGVGGGGGVGGAVGGTSPNVSPSAASRDTANTPNSGAAKIAALREKARKGGRK